MTVRNPHALDIAQLVLRMRAADRAELRAAGCTNVAQEIADGVRRSALAKAVIVDGELACIFGLAPLSSTLGDRGVPWMLGTPTLARHAKLLMRAAPTYLADMTRTYRYLLNVVHAENTRAIAWLRRMGFAVDSTARPYGPHNALFYGFKMER